MQNFSFSSKFGTSWKQNSFFVVGCSADKCSDQADDLWLWPRVGRSCTADGIAQNSHRPREHAGIHECKRLNSHTNYTGLCLKHYHQLNKTSYFGSSRKLRRPSSWVSSTSTACTSWLHLCWQTQHMIKTQKVSWHSVEWVRPVDCYWLLCVVVFQIYRRDQLR